MIWYDYRWSSKVDIYVLNTKSWALNELVYRVPAYYKEIITYIELNCLFLFLEYHIEMVEHYIVHIIKNQIPLMPWIMD